LRVSGFGTPGVVHASEREADYTSSVMKASGAGGTRRWSAVLQVVSEQGLDNSYRPRVEWANVKYEVTPELAVRAGRIGPAGQALGARYAPDHKRLTLVNIGLNYAPGTWFLMAEAGRTNGHSFLGTTRSAYVGAGWRWRAFTSYATWASVHATGATSDPGLPVAALPPAPAPTAAALNAGLNALLATIPQQTSAAAGLRWDLRTNMALKLQVDRVTPHDGSRGTLINQTPRFRSGHTVHVASVALDFVY